VWLIATLENINYTFLFKGKIMTDFNNEQLDEIHCLNLFDLKNTQVGLKVHNTAKPESIAAMKRLYEKGLVSEDDGGYLTAPGQEAAELAQSLLVILRP
jgi:uncharacterized protein (TIGR02647 family)